MSQYILFTDDMLSRHRKLPKVIKQLLKHFECFKKSQQNKLIGMCVIRNRAICISGLKLRPLVNCI